MRVFLALMTKTLEQLRWKKKQIIELRADGFTKRGLYRQWGEEGEGGRRGYGCPSPLLAGFANQPGEAAGTGRASRVTQRRVSRR